MNIFTIFFYKIVTKYTTERIKLHHFKFFFLREHAPEPPSIQVASPRSAYGTKRYANRLTFHKLT